MEVGTDSPPHACPPSAVTVCSGMTATWCNPLPLPNYPIGRAARVNDGWGFIQPERADFRETADPTVVYHDGRWYLYPSCGMAYVSEDFTTWRHTPLNLPDVGYAPTVVRHGERWLLTACGAPLYEASSPLGPFAAVGPFVRPNGSPVPEWNDPMLFADDDGRIYAYWGLGGPGIFGAELDRRQPQRLLGEPRILFAYDRDHAWERYGEHNEDPSKSFVESPWMVKAQGRYYLTYAAPGTEWRTYGMGAYVGDGPLGPFRYQEVNPICARGHGLIQGPGHGCIVRGPGDSLWAFYTCRVCYEHIFERRVGMDRAVIDAHGNLVVPEVSDVPQPAPGSPGTTGWKPLSARRPHRTSSAAPGRVGLYALDDCMHTWWEPAGDDRTPWLEVDLQNTFTLRAARLIWKDVGLDARNRVLPGPFRWRLLAERDGAWTTLADRSASGEDLLIDYREFAAVRCARIRLEIAGWPPGIRPGLVQLTVFGEP